MTKLYGVEPRVQVLVEAETIEEARRTIALLLSDLGRQLPTGVAYVENLGDTLRRVEQR